MEQAGGYHLVFVASVIQQFGHLQGVIDLRTALTA